MRPVADLTAPAAYRVPFRLDRSDGPGLQRLRNASAETLYSVRLQLDGPGVMAASAPAVLAPGETLKVLVRGDDLPRDTLLVVRWFRADGDEYLWRIAF